MQTKAYHTDLTPASRAQSRSWTHAKLACIAFLTLLGSFGMLRGPIVHCYHRASQHLCSKPQSVEERALQILSSNPLIGKLV